MSLSAKPLESLEEADLVALIENSVPESRIIEYKESLPANSDSAKLKFLADVTSFANAAGGHLVFGIKEKAGVPIELRGLNVTDADAEILRLENIIRDGIEPRIPGTSMRAVPLKASEVAMVISIPRSWALPHRVIFGGRGHFYSRNSAGKYPLDVSELRAAFALSETTTEHIRGFRAERLSMVVARETPGKLVEGAATVLHIVPVRSFDPSISFDVSSLAQDTARLGPINGHGWSYRHNLDGFLTYTSDSSSYLQIFRSGAIEAVDTGMLTERPSAAPSGRLIRSVAYERELIESLARFLSIQKRLGVEPPVFLMLSLLGVSGYTMAVNPRFWRDRVYPIDRDSLVLPDIAVENFECDPTEVLRPAFDAIWNAAGWPRSMNYNDEGKWVGH